MKRIVIPLVFVYVASVFISVLVRGTIAMMKYCDPKQIGDGRIYLTYTSTSLSFIKRSQDRNSKRAGTASRSGAHL